MKVLTGHNGCKQFQIEQHSHSSTKVTLKPSSQSVLGSQVTRQLSSYSSWVGRVKHSSEEYLLYLVDL